MGALVLFSRDIRQSTYLTWLLCWPNYGAVFDEVTRNALRFCIVITVYERQRCHNVLHYYEILTKVLLGFVFFAEWQMVLYGCHE